MKKLTLLVLALSILITTSMSAAELQHVQITNQKAHPQIIHVTSDKKVVAEVKLVQDATLNVVADKIAMSKSARLGMFYECTGNCTVVMSVDNKTVLNLSGEHFSIQPSPTSAPAKSK